VGGLPQNTTANELRDNFEKFGVVSDAVVMIDPATNRSRGFGFVCFLPGQEGAEAVTSALQQYDNHRIRGKWIEVKSAAPPHKLAKENEAAAQDPPGFFKATPPNENGCEEWKLSGAVQTTPWMDKDHRSGAVPTLGSPRKVAIPSSADLPNLLSPVRLAEPMFSNVGDSLKPGLVPSHNPWAARSWGNPYAQGIGPLPPFAYSNYMHADTNRSGYNGSADVGKECFGSPPCMDQSGLTAAESLQQNLALFLRQSSMDQKLEWGMSKGLNRDPSPSTSTACSSSTRAEIAHPDTV